MSRAAVTGEVSNGKVAGVFTSRSAARDAASAVITEAGLQRAQVKLIAPGEADADIMIEPEGEGIWRTIVVAHVRLGIVGAIVGLLAFGLLLWIGVPFVAASPWIAASVLVAFCALAGLLLGGLVSSRPDHDRYIEATRDAMDAGRTTVVVHALSSEQQSRAAAELKRRGAKVTQTL